MKNLLFVLMFSFVLVACKKDSPQPVLEIAAIVGSWKHIANEKFVNGMKTWVSVNGEPNYMSFRSDGLIVDSNGLPACCAPRAYFVNGVLFEVKPATPVPVNERCHLVDCRSCSTWDIEQNGNELIVYTCEPVSLGSKYIRE